jgi:hypothetical protein
VEVNIADAEWNRLEDPEGKGKVSVYQEVEHDCRVRAEDEHHLTGRLSLRVETLAREAVATHIRLEDQPGEEEKQEDYPTKVVQLEASAEVSSDHSVE